MWVNNVGCLKLEIGNNEIFVCYDKNFHNYCPECEICL